MRRAQAYQTLEKLDEALADVTRILEIDASYPKAKEMKYVCIAPCMHYFTVIIFYC
jgi:hypothetical protein